MTEPNETRIFVTHAPHVELEIVVVARVYNGIDADPRVRLRQPSLEELYGCLETVRGGEFRFVPDLDYAVEGFNAKAQRTPREEEGGEERWGVVEEERGARRPGNGLGQDAPATEVPFAETGTIHTGEEAS